MADPGFWAGKRVLITGHTGFKGGWLCLWLHRMGAQVLGYALNPPTHPSLFETARVGEAVESVIADVRDPERISGVVARFLPEVVFHLAAQPLVRYSYTNPIETYATNVLGTVHLFEAVRRAGATRVLVNVTSDKCYENREWIWGYREHEAMGGYDPYSSSKGCAELVTSAYRSSFFNPARIAEHGTALASVRAGNVIGGGDWAEDRLIPDLVRAILAGQPAVIRRPHAIRPWQHVLEPLHGYLMLAERLWDDGAGFAEGWNFGPGDEESRPVSWIADLVVALWGDGASWRLDTEQHPHEAHYLRLDSSKARTRLGWRPQWGIEQALRATVEWFKAWQKRADMRRTTLDQIETYAAGATNQ
jgi:CDP-glucose 4,6-dehydratase